MLKFRVFRLLLVKKIKGEWKMKKLKTIVSSVIIVLASIFVSACSCSGSGDAPAVYATDIDLKVTSTSQTIKIIDGEIPEIQCNVDDTFSIEYTLSPVTTTVTTVSWAPEDDNDKSLVKCLSRESSRSKSTKEKVDFVAVTTSQNNNELTLVFKANAGTSAVKEAKVHITIGPKITELPTLILPVDGVGFTNNTNTLKWEPVTQLLQANKSITNVPSGTVAQGLLSYRIVDRNGNLTTKDGVKQYLPDNSGATYVDTKDAITTSYDGIKAGVEYDIEIHTNYDSNWVKPSEPTNAFRFYKLETITPATLDNQTGLRNEDGVLKFTTPKFAPNYRIYYYGLDNSGANVYQSSTEETKVSLNIASTFSGYNYGDKYKFQVVSYPANYDSEDGYATENNVRYYPSTPRNEVKNSQGIVTDRGDVLTVQKLESPTITLESIKDAVTVDSVQFEDAYKDTQIKISVEDTYSGYGLGFDVKLYQKTDDNGFTGVSYYTVNTTANDNQIVVKFADNIPVGCEYKIVVQTTGNLSTIVSDTEICESTVLPSTQQELLFSVKNPIGKNDAVNPDKYQYEIYIENDVLSILDTMNKVDGEDVSKPVSDGVELFFVNQDNPSKSQRFEIPKGANELARNISKLGLASGEYKLYAKFLFDANNNVVIVNPSNYGNGIEVNIASQVSNVNITASGALTFNSPQDNNITKYNIIINQKSQEYGKDDVSYEAVVEQKTENNSFGYILSNNVISIDLIGFIKENIIKTLPAYEKNPTDANLEYLFDSYLSQKNTFFTCQVQSCGDGSSSLVSSSPTIGDTCKFSRRVLVESFELIAEEDKKTTNYFNYLTFDPAGGENVSYVIGIREWEVKEVTGNDSSTSLKETLVNTYTFSHTTGGYTSSSSGKVKINLHTEEKLVKVASGAEFSGYNDTTTYYFMDVIQYILKTRPANKLSITVMVKGSDTDSMNHIAYIDSKITNQPVSSSNVVDDIQMDTEGNISWSSGDLTELGENRKYLLKFFSIDGNTEKHECNAIPSVSMDSSSYRISTDIDEILGEYPNQLIAIEIQEVIVDALINNVSTRYYTIKLGAPALSYADEINSTPGYYIKWNAVSSTIENINYEINATKNEATVVEESGESTSSEFPQTTNKTYFEIPSDWEIAEYNISVKAVPNNVSDNSITNPYIITSEQKSTSLYITSGDVTVTPNGDEVQWNNISYLPNNKKYRASYTIEYTPAGESKVTTLIQCKDNSETQEDESLWLVNKADIDNEVADPTLIPISYVTNSTISLDVKDRFKAGANTIKITPAMDFTKTGHIVKFSSGSASENTINKWTTAQFVMSSGSTATAQITTDGYLQFKVDGGDSNTQFELYEFNRAIENPTTADLNNIANYSKVEEDESKYKQTNYSNNIFEVDLKGFEAGKIYLRIRIKSNEKLTSDYSDIFEATKIDTIQDLNKELNAKGDWITWSATPGISKYELTYRHENSSVNNTISLVVEYTDLGEGKYKYTPKILTSTEGGGTGWITNENIFFYNDYKFYYKFQPEVFFAGEKEGPQLEGLFYFTVRPLTSVQGYYNGSVSNTLSITKFNDNTELSIVDGQLYIAPYTPLSPNEALPQSYDVVIYKLDNDGERTTVSTTKTIMGYQGVSIDFNDLGGDFINAGGYDIEVTYYGDPNQHTQITSETILFSSRNKLDTTKLSATDGVVTWGSVEGATNYTIWLTADGGVSYEFTINGNVLLESDLKYYEKPQNNNQGGDTPTVVDETNEEGGATTPPAQGEEKLFELSPGTLYTLRLRANGGDKNLNSKFSDPFLVKKLYAPIELEIATNAEEYTYTYEVKVEGEPGEEGTTTTTSEPITIHVGAPVITWKLNNEVWTKDEEDNTIKYPLSYVLKYDEATLVQIAKAIEKDSLYRFHINKDMPVGDYGLQLQVIGTTSTAENGFAYLTSNFSSAKGVKYRADVYAPTMKDGNIEWEQVSGAYSYQVIIYDKSTYDTSGTNATPITTRYTSLTSINFANLGINTTSCTNYAVVVNAITDPTNSIVTNHASVAEGMEKEGKTKELKVFKPAQLYEFKVKEGQLNWKIGVADIEAFAGEKAKAENIIKYVVAMINNGTTDESSQLPEGFEQTDIEHLMKVNININGTVSAPVTPTKVVMIESDGSETNDVNNAKYLEYYYELPGDPEVNKPVVEEGESGTSGTDAVAFSTRTSDATNVATDGSVPGKYLLSIAAPGNSSETIPVVNGAYTRVIQAFKPTTPKTWGATDTNGDGTYESGSDITEGKVQWGLSTTPNFQFNASSGGTNTEPYEYYHRYRIEAKLASGDTNVIAYKDIDTEEMGTTINGYQHYVFLTQSVRDTESAAYLFTTDDRKAGGDITNILTYNTNYNLLVYSRGTIDSGDSDGEDTPIYLNSNRCQFGAVANILQTSQNVKVQNNILEWTPSTGSTMTKVFIYGPFNNLDTTDEKFADGDISNATTIVSWYDEDKYSLANLDALKATKPDLYREVTFKEGAKNRNQYTLTKDLILNSEEYKAGGYIFRFQEIGDRKGVVDSIVSEDRYAVNKLDSVIKQSGSSNWVGTSNSNIYVWQSGSDTWLAKAKDEENAFVDDEIGTIGAFVWNPVLGANGYQIRLFAKNKNGLVIDLQTIRFTRETRYEYEDNGLQATKFNDMDYEYYIEVIAIRTESGNQLTGVETSVNLADNYFYSDARDSSMHTRVNVPTDIYVYDTGMIQWNNNVTEPDAIGQFRFVFNDTAIEYVDGLTLDPEQLQKQAIAMSTDGQKGTTTFRLKAVAKDGAELLNSCYCINLTITRLADPSVRLIDGVFHWGLPADENGLTSQTSQTDSKLLINNSPANYGDKIGDKADGIIPAGDNTYYKYFTDITTHVGGKNGYKSENDATSFATGSYTFNAQFLGSGGENGVLMVDSETQLPISYSNLFIASRPLSLTADKLETPTIENDTLTLSGSTSNMVKWKSITNAQGYRVRVFYSSLYSLDGEKEVYDKYDTYDVSYDSLDNIKNGTTMESDLRVLRSGAGNYDTLNSSDYFVVTKAENNTISDIYFKLDTIISNAGLTNGGYIWIYVQALGSGILGDVAKPTNAQGGTNTLFLSSSYSDYTTVTLPPKVSTIKFENGLVTWGWEDGEAPEGAMNVKLQNEYVVNEVTEDELTDYWQATSDHYYGLNESGVKIAGSETTNDSPTRPYSEIIRRTMIYQATNDGNYKVQVTDIIYLQNNGTTPTSYKLTSIGEQYKVSITILSFTTTGENEEENNFASPTAYITGLNFNAFVHGDGSEYYPYEVNSYTHLENIRGFSDRHFALTSDIDMVYSSGENQGQIYPWIALEEFSGVLDGGKYDDDGEYDGNYTIKNFTFDMSSALKDDGAQAIYLAFAKENSGTIKNLNIEVNFSDINAHNYTMNVSTIATNNTGTIDNVHVKGAMDQSSQSTAGTLNILNKGTSGGTNVAGLVIDNQGTISNSSVFANIVSLDNTNNPAYAGGIARKNSGTITNTNFNGSIRSNYFGGIVAELEANGIVNECNVLSDTILYATDEIAEVYYASSLNPPTMTISKHVTAGGLVGSMKENTSITDCSSEATILGFQGDSTSTKMAIAGLVAYVEESKTVTITGSRVVVKFGAEVVDATSDQDSDPLPYRNGNNIISNSSGQGAVVYYFVNSNTFVNNSGTNASNNTFVVENAGGLTITTVNGVANT